jgi:hypothetical protein
MHRYSEGVPIIEYLREVKPRFRGLGEAFATALFEFRLI